MKFIRSTVPGFALTASAGYSRAAEFDLTGDIACHNDVEMQDKQ